MIVLKVIPSITFWSTLAPKSAEKTVPKTESISRSFMISSEDSSQAILNPSPKSESFNPPDNSSLFTSASATVFQFPTIVNGQTLISGVPVRPVAAALGQPIPADQVSTVASQLTSHMSNVTSPIHLMASNVKNGLTSKSTTFN